MKNMKINKPPYLHLQGQYNIECIFVRIMEHVK